MQMDAGMDTGAMLAKRSIEIGEMETAPELSARLSELGAAVLSDTLPKIERGEIIAEPQNNDEATYAPMLKREDGQLNWQWTATEIGNRVRAFQPWPGVYTILRGARLHLWRARPEDFADESMGLGAPGTILRVDRDGMMIRCAGGTALRIEECQIEGKRRVAAREFANGMRLKAGDRIGDAP